MCETAYIFTGSTFLLLRHSQLLFLNSQTVDELRHLLFYREKPQRDTERRGKKRAYAIACALACTTGIPALNTILWAIFCSQYSLVRCVMCSGLTPELSMCLRVSFNGTVVIQRIQRRTDIFKETLQTFLGWDSVGFSFRLWKRIT